MDHDREPRSTRHATDIGEISAKGASAGSYVETDLREQQNLVPHFQRAIHSFTILGLATSFCVMAVVYLAFLAQQPWSVPNENGVPTLNLKVELNFILLPAALLYWIATWSNVSHSTDWDDAGPQFARIPLVLGATLVPVYYGILWLLIESGTDIKYRGLDLLFFFAFSAIFIVFDVSLRSAWSKSNKESSNQATPPRKSLKLQPELISPLGRIMEVRAEEEPQRLWSVFVRFVLRYGSVLLPFFATVVIGVGCIINVPRNAFTADPFVILPTYFSSSTSTRLFYVLILHPILLESAEAFGRSGSVDTVTLAGSPDDDEETLSRRAFQGTLFSMPFKQIMAFYRRFMLLNVGDASYTIIAVMSASVEEALTRSFVCEIDNAIRRWRGKADLTETELRRQHLVLMADINLSLIAETSAIILTSVVLLILEPHSRVFAFGYEPGTPLSAGLVFVQLLLELFLEIVVDNVVMWSEAEHDIDPTAYFRWARSPLVGLFMMTTLMIGLISALFGFLRHPFVATCDSNSICGCIGLPQFREWFSDPCNLLESSSKNMTASEVSDIFLLSQTTGILDNVLSLDTVIASAMTMVLMLSLVCGSVLYSRYRQRQRAIERHRRNHQEGETDGQFSVYLAQMVLNRTDNTATLWDRFLHNCTLIGAAMVESLPIILFLFLVQNGNWRVHEDGHERKISNLNFKTELDFILLPLVTTYWIGTWAHVCHACDWSDAGPRYGRVTLVTGSVMVPLYYGFISILIDAGIDVKYYALDAISVMIFVLLFVLIDVGLRRKWLNYDQDRSATTDSCNHSVGDVAEPGSKNNPSTLSDTTWFIQIIQQIGTTIGVVFVYPLLILPSYFSSNTSFRFVVVLIIHPILLEGAESFGRTGKQEAAAQGGSADDDEETIARRAVQSTLITLPLKQFMAFYRRFMLLNVGDASTTLIAVMLAGIEESLTRSFVCELDNQMRKWRGKPELRGAELHRQRLVLMADINLSVAAEITAIILSSVALIVLETHSSTFSLGYEAGVPVLGGAVFVQLLLELFVETVVDNIAMWSEAEHGIDVTIYFEWANSPYVGLYWLCTAASSFAGGLFGLLLHPIILTCNSNKICECLDLPQFQAFVSSCTAVSNLTEITNTTAGPDYSNSSAMSSVADIELDIVPLFVSLLCTALALALIIASVIYARYHRRNKVLHEIVNEREAAKSRARAADERVEELEKIVAKANAAAGRIFDAETRARLDPHRIAFCELSMGKVLGSGSYGVVHEGIYRSEKVAIKLLRQSKIDTDLMRRFKFEVEIMVPLHHKNLTRLRGACFSDGTDALCLVLEFCKHGSLESILSSSKLVGTWKTTRLKLAIGISTGMKVLHHDLETPLVHRDLKPSNILVGDGMVPKIADFGESRPFVDQTLGDNTEIAVLTAGVGTPMWMSPEVLRGERYTTAVDVYAYSLILLELALGSTSLIRRQFSRVSSLAISEGWRPEIPEDELPYSIESLVRECWRDLSTDRPTFWEVLIKLRDQESKNDSETLSKVSENHSSSIIPRSKTVKDSDGILGGMFMYAPNRSESLLGEGKFGSVHRMVNPNDDRVYAVKELRNIVGEEGTLNKSEYETVRAEVQKMGTITSEFIVRYFTSALERGAFYIVMEYLDGEEYKNVVITRRQVTSQPFALVQLASWLRQLAMGLQHIHDEYHLVHQDLHNGNVMVVWPGQARRTNTGHFDVSDEGLRNTKIKILDLGLAAHRRAMMTKTSETTSTFRSRNNNYSSQKNKSRTRNGLRMFAPIESIAGFKAIRPPEKFGALEDDQGNVTLRNESAHFDAKSDVWALGVLLCEAVLLLPIEEWFDSREMMMTFGYTRLLQRAKIEEVGRRSEQFGDLLEMIWSWEPRHRLSARGVLERMAAWTSAGGDGEENKAATEVMKLKQQVAADAQALLAETTRLCASGEADKVLEVVRRYVRTQTNQAARNKMV